MRQFTNLLIVLLLISSALGFLAYGLTAGDSEEGEDAVNNLILACALLVIVTLTCAMSYWQERQAGNVLASIQGMLPSSTKVVRGGQEVSVPADSLVPGDIVHLTIGNRVPADIRIIAANDLKVEMSSLTGESDAVECGPERRADLPTEAHNLLFNSSMIMNGDCYGVVYRTGDKSMIGVIAGMAGGSGQARRTTMEVEVHRLLVFVALAAIATAITFFIIGLARGFGIVFSFVNAFILVLVANVPEGLPASVTSILTLSAQSLATHNVFIKRTDLIETLGCASVICSDKTGTLTQNKMSVSQLWFNGVVINALARVKRVSGPAAHALAVAQGRAQWGVPLPAPRAQRGRAGRQAAMPSPSGMEGGPDAPAPSPAAGGGGVPSPIPESPTEGGEGEEAPTLEERDIAAEMTIGRGMSMIGGTMFIHSLLHAGAAPIPPSSEQGAVGVSTSTTGRGKQGGRGAADVTDRGGTFRSPTGILSPRPPAPLAIMWDEGGPSPSPGPGPGQGQGARHRASPTGLDTARPTLHSFPAATAGSIPVLPGPSPAEDSGTLEAEGQPPPILAMMSFQARAPLAFARGQAGEVHTQIRGIHNTVAGATGISSTVPDSPLPTLTSPAPLATTPLHTPTPARAGTGSTTGRGQPPVLPSPAGEGGPEGTPARTSGSIGRQGTLPPGMAVASFQSFRGFTKASWTDSNAFTRLMTIAAVCNRAKFAGVHGDEVEGQGGASAAPIPLPPHTGPGDTAGLVTTATGAKTSKSLPEGALALGPVGGTPTATTTAGRSMGDMTDSRAVPVMPDVPSKPAVTAPALVEGPGGGAALGSPQRLTGGKLEYGVGGLPLGPSMGPSALRALLTGPPGSSTTATTSSWLKPSAGTGDARKVLGDASEAALLRYADSLVPVHEFRAAYPLLFEIPFNSANKWAYAVVPAPEEPGPVHPHEQASGVWPLGTGCHIALMKGAPERIIDRCSHWLKEGTGSGGAVQEVPIDDAFKAQWSAAYERFGLSGERVLAFAYRTFTPPQGAPACYKTQEESRPMSGLVFAGLISLVDPPKEGVAEAVAVCRGASIRVSMVTGDHPLTAEAIARKVGIITMKTAREVAAEAGVPESSIALDDPRVGAVVLPGYALPQLSEGDWDTVLSKKEVVFARTSPQQKTEIVSHYQRLGHIVAVTGDGTNDAPALKQADMGIAMGSAGASDVAREAADMVLTDDNFASIVVAITMGRTVFDNIRKTIAYTLAHAVPELLPIFALLVLDIPLMLVGLLVLTIDLLTEQWPAISLAYEPAEAAVMQKPPRDMKRDRLVDGRLLRYSYLWVGLGIFFISTAAFFLTTNYYGIPGSFFLNRRDNWSSTSSLLFVNGRAVTGSQQEEVWRRGVAAFYLTLILCQGWHVFLCKTRSQSIFKHGIFRNRQSVYGVLSAIALGCFFVYVPGVNNLFDTRNPSFWPWVLHFIFPAVYIPFTEYNKWKVRHQPQSKWARHVSW